MFCMPVPCLCRIVYILGYAWIYMLGSQNNNKEKGERANKRKKKRLWGWVINKKKNLRMELTEKRTFRIWHRSGSCSYGSILYVFICSSNSQLETDSHSIQTRRFTWTLPTFLFCFVLFCLAISVFFGSVRLNGPAHCLHFQNLYTHSDRWSQEQILTFT